jgi:hypothetical protein
MELGNGNGNSNSDKPLNLSALKKEVRARVISKMADLNFVRTPFPPPFPPLQRKNKT